MTDFNRRRFIQRGALGVAAAGAGSLLLSPYALPTEPSGTEKEYSQFIALTGDRPLVEIPAAAPPTPFRPTEDNIEGPYFRPGAPFRAKITPPLEPGKPLVVRGRVWGIDTKKPLRHARLDIWQANAKGSYDNDDPANPPKKNVFYNRARLVADETGYYEYETVWPGRYSIGPGRYRPAHIHYLAAASGYKPLITQLYFKDDPENGRDDFIKESLIMDVEKIDCEGGSFYLGTFDVVLTK